MMASLRRFPAILITASVLLLAAACGQAPSPTANTAATAAQALTVIASMPTAAALHPKPTALGIAADVGNAQPADTPVATASHVAAVPAVPAVTPTEPAATPETTATALATATAAPAVTDTPVATALSAATAASVDYTVQDGDTLLSIALASKVSMAAIMLANDMNDTQIVKLGQALHIPAGPTWPGENPFWFVYVVQSGEALSTIAARFDVNVDDLVRVNQLSDASAIKDQQRLVIPASSLRPAPAAAPVNQVEAAPTDPPAVEMPAAATAAPVAQPIPAAPTASAGAAANLASVAGAETYRAQLLTLYNQARAAAGLPPLSLSPVLQSAAQLHAQDCAQRGYGSHIGSDGSDPRQRIAHAGYPGRTYGENWAWGRSAAGAFDAWFNQEAGGGPHRSNILSKRYTEVGFGIAASVGGFYFIADFGAP